MGLWDKLTSMKRPEVGVAVCAADDVRQRILALNRTTAADLELRCERMSDLRALALRLDSRGAFRNEFLERTIWGR